MTLSVIHDRLGNAALAYFLIIALWGYWRFFRKQGLDSSFWGSLVIGELFLLAEVLLGAVLWITGERPARGVHLLYGFIALAALPMAYAYTKGREERAEILIYGTTTLFTVGLIFRAIDTAI